MLQIATAPLEELEFSQDNDREFGQIALFGLTAHPGRLGHDATCSRGFKYELKTTTKTSGGISTARDLGPHKIDEWRGYYWIVTRGKKVKGQPFRGLRHFFLAPQHMEGWYGKLEAGFNADKALAEKVKLLSAGGLSEQEAARHARMLHRGMLLNDPTIPWGYIEKNGIEIVANHAATLASLVEQFPISGDR
jgi:hypothetical protein